MYKERIANLMHAVKDEPDDLEFIEGRMNAFTDYVGYVVHMETRMQMLNARGVDGQEWRDAVEAMDSNRKSKHDVCIGAINQLNRLCEAEGLEPFYDGPTDDAHRTRVGDEIGRIVNEYFEGRAVGKLKQQDLMSDDDFTKAVSTIPESSIVSER